MIIALIFAGSFALVSFGAALIFYDRWRKERVVSARLLKLADQEGDALARSIRVTRTWEIQCAELRALASYWCNEAIQNERAAAKEYAERKRWERLYADRLPRRVN